MRLNEFILTEYKRDITTNKLGDKLLATAKNEGIEDIEQILSQLESMDPTKHKQYVEWLCRQYINKQFRLEDASRVLDVLSKFENAKRNLQQKDINRYTFYSLDDEMDKVYNVDLGKDNKQQADGTYPVVPESKVLYNGPLGQLAIPGTKEASCELGCGTKWCTAANKDNAFKTYSSKSPLYIWRDKNGEKYQFYFGPMMEIQLRDAQDRDINSKTINYFRTKHPVLSKLFKQKEIELMKDPMDASFYASDIIKGRWPEAEPDIIRDSDAASVYARDVLNGRWPEAEPVIIKDPRSAAAYAKNVIKGRWPEAEPDIMKDSRAAFEYASTVIKGRWPEAEPYIMKDPMAAYWYAYKVLDKKRWPEAEPYIMKDPRIAANYAESVIKGRWPEAEAYIKQDAYEWGEYTHFLHTGPSKSEI